MSSGTPPAESSIFYLNRVLNSFSCIGAGLFRVPIVSEKEGDILNMADIIDFFSRKKQKGIESSDSCQEPVAAKEDYFSSIAHENHQKQEKMRKERAQANKTVMKNYKIK